MLLLLETTVMLKCLSNPLQSAVCERECAVSRCASLSVLRATEAAALPLCSYFRIYDEHTNNSMTTYSCAFSIHSTAFPQCTNYCTPHHIYHILNMPVYIVYSCIYICGCIGPKLPLQEREKAFLALN